MTFKELYREVELYLNMEGADARHHIKSFINDSIIDFVRLYNWQFANVEEQIIIEDNKYELSNLSHRYEGIINLFVGKSLYTKFDYHTFLQSSGASSYSIFGNTLYINGKDLEATLIYKTTGYKYTDFIISNISGTDTFILAGDFTDYFRGKLFIRVANTDNKDNNGFYTISDINFAGGNTEIVVNETIPEPTNVSGLLGVERSNILEFDTDRSIITDHYYDVIKHMAAMKMVYYLGDESEYQKEESLTTFKINNLKRHENRMHKEGMMKVVAR